MVKIRRNQPCPCKSGKKYKHCCLLAGKVFENEKNSQAAQVKNSLLSQIQNIQDMAREKSQVVRDHGVFIFFSNSDGDAWMLEVAGMDGLQVARAGDPLDIELEENPETIEINWSHTWVIRNKSFFLTSYEDKKETELVNASSQQINAARIRIHKRYTADMLAGIHLPENR